MRRTRLIIVGLTIACIAGAWWSATISKDVVAPALAQHDEHEGHDHAQNEHDEHDEHDAHDAHDGHDEHEGDALNISPDVMREFGIEMDTAQSGTIAREVSLPGEVVFNADRIAHVTPTVSGIVREGRYSVGDQVTAGAVMAVLNSRELAAARSAYLAAQAHLALARENLSAKEDLFRGRIKLANDNLERDRRLFEEKVGTERQLLAATQALEELRITFDLEKTEANQRIREAEINANQAENALHALGYSHEQIDRVRSIDETDFNTYELVAPLSGVVTQRHLTIGEVIDPDSAESPFVIADLSKVWVNLTVYQRDLVQVRAGQAVTIHFGHGLGEARGTIAFVSPALDEKTRTATARVVLANANGQYRPGLFVTARIEAGNERAAVVVPRGAVTQVDGRTAVFVETGEGIEPKPVRVGRSNETSVEIVEGLSVGERYVSRNTLALKAELNRAALEHAGHAH